MPRASSIRQRARQREGMPPRDPNDDDDDEDEFYFQERFCQKRFAFVL